MKIAALVVLALALGGCVPAREFGQGFKAGLEREAVDAVAGAAADAVDRKLGEKFSGVSETLRSLPDKMPKPPDRDPSQDTLWYGIGGLAAYLVGSFVKGGYRKYQEKTGKDS